MARTPLPPAPAPEKGWRRRLAIPNLLAPAVAPLRLQSIRCTPDAVTVKIIFDE
jgi:hypothetical protein